MSSAATADLPRQHRIVQALFLVGLALGTWWNVHFVLAHPDSPAIYNLGIDTKTYDAIARAVWQSGDVARLLKFSHPGYTGVLALLYALFHGSRLAAKIVFCGLVSAMAMLVWLMGRRGSGETVGGVAGLLVVFGQMFHAYAATLQYQITAAFLVTAAVAAIVAALAATAPRRSVWLFAGAAALCALAMAVRKALIVMFPVLFVAVILCPSFSRRLRAAIVAVSAVGIVAFGVGGLAVGATPRVVTLWTDFRGTLQWGNNPNADGTYSALRPPVAPAGWQFVRDEPLAALALTGRRTAYFFGFLKDGWNVPRPLALYLSRGALNLLPLDWWLRLARGSLVSLLALLGLVMLWRSPAWSVLWPAPAAVAALFGVHALTFSSHRFALPIWPMVDLLAAWPLAWCAERFVRAGWRWHAAAVVVLVWLFVAQRVSGPGIYRRPAPELRMLDTERIPDPESASRTVLYARARPRARMVALDTDELLPQGYLLVVLGLRVNAASLATPRPLVDVVMTDGDGRILCGGAIRTGNFVSTAYHDIPMRCDLATSQVVSFQIWTEPGVELWLDRFSVRFGYPDQDRAVFPGEGPRAARAGSS